MNNVIEAPFADQVVHICKPDDDDQKPLCGTDPEGVFVAESGSALKAGWRWCRACHTLDDIIPMERR